MGFEYDGVDESECLAEFRFQKRHIPLLAEVLQIPDQFSCYPKSVLSGIEGLCILLKRLSYPCRYSDMIALWQARSGREYGEQSGAR